MKKKNHKPNGTLFSPELRAVIGRLEHREPELDVIVDRPAEAQVKSIDREHDETLTD